MNSDQEEEEFQMIMKCLENVLCHEEDEKEKTKMAAIIRKYERTRNKKQLFALTSSQQKMLTLLIDGFMSYKDSFHEATNEEKYHFIKETNFDIVTFLLDVQPNITFNRQKPTFDMIVSKYTFNLLKLKKKKQLWSKQFLTYWTFKAKDRLKQIQNDRLVQSQKQTPSNDKQEAQGNNQPEPEPQPQPQPKSSYRQERQPEKRTDKQKKGDNAKSQSKKTEEDTKYKMNLLEDYLKSRKNITKGENQNLKEVTAFILYKLSQFMKSAIEKIIDIAALKNKKDSKLGNQIGYFAQQNKNVHVQAPFYVSPGSKVFTLLYKHKLEIYTTLRANEIKKEDDLRTALQSQIKYDKRKIDKKLEGYLLKPRPKEIEPIEVFKEKNGPNISKAHANELLISAEHVIYYLEDHRYLKNSLLLFNAYQY